MSQICSVCGRGALTANTRSKSMTATKTRQRVNMQSRRLQGMRVKICTRCLKSRSKNPQTMLPSSPVKRATKRRNKRQAK